MGAAQWTEYRTETKARISRGENITNLVCLPPTVVQVVCANNTRSSSHFHDIPIFPSYGLLLNSSDRDASSRTLLSLRSVVSTGLPFQAYSQDAWPLSRLQLRLPALTRRSWTTRC